MDKGSGLYHELAVIIGGVVLAVAAIFVAKNYSLWVLVPIPAAIGLVYHLLNLSSRFESRKSVVEAYREFTCKFDRAWANTEQPTRVSEDLADDMERHKPSLASMLWGAALLTAVFAVPAVISDGGRALKPATDPNLVRVAAALTEAEKAASASTPATARVKSAVTTAQGALKAAQNGLPAWQRGLVFAGFGVWVLIVMRMIGRINAGGLNARFLMTASMRAGAAMMLGFFAGATAAETRLFDASSATAATTYFLIGVFYPLFFEQLRDEAYKLFKRNKSITSELPTNWVDGVDDDTEDILRELNVLSVQHLATSDPGVLTVRSLFPFTRVVDLIDQAILITYFREKIVILRKFGIRGVIDLISTMEPVVRGDANRAAAEKAIGEIAAALEMSVEALMTIGMSVYNDYRVNLLMRLWQHNVQADGFTVQREIVLAPERIPITGEGVASYSAFVDLVDAELRREAAERAARFREQNPGVEAPPDDWLRTSFGEAYAAALQKATRQPNDRTRNVYEEAFRSALG